MDCYWIAYYHFSATFGMQSLANYKNDICFAILYMYR